VAREASPTWGQVVGSDEMARQKDFRDGLSVFSVWVLPLATAALQPWLQN
jgi:hypothetical protein